MALKALMLRKKINDKKAALDALRAKDADFEKREQELEASIAEAKTEEEKTMVEAAVGDFEAEKAQHEKNKADLDKSNILRRLKAVGLKIFIIILKIKRVGG